jgi:S1-C subfamily serine protease
MTDRGDALSELSSALAARAEAARAHVRAVRSEHRGLSGVLWESDVVVTSAQSLPKGKSFTVMSSDGGTQEAALAGVDPATNIAVLKVAAAPQARPLLTRVPNLGELVLACGADRDGRISVRLGTVHALGDAWHSRMGGQIDKRIGLDVGLARFEEGGPVFDVNGGFVGMTTFAPRRRVIAIPAATLARVVPALLKDGRVPRGWLGVALQPVAVPEAFRTETGQSAALMAMAVAADGPAAKAGLVAGDIVLGIDGQETQRMRGLMAKLGADSIGRRIELRIARSGAIQSLSLTVEARPPQ